MYKYIIKYEDGTIQKKELGGRPHGLIHKGKRPIKIDVYNLGDIHNDASVKRCCLYAVHPTKGKVTFHE